MTISVRSMIHMSINQYKRINAAGVLCIPRFQQQDL
jgi:hypothetical protein